MDRSPFQITIRRCLFAVLWFGVCAAMLRAWWQTPDEFVYLVFGVVAFCILSGTLFKRSAVGALVGFVLVTACLIVANIAAVVQLF
jgi:hypothetical protein